MQTKQLRKTDKNTFADKNIVVKQLFSWST